MGSETAAALYDERPVPGHLRQPIPQLVQRKGECPRTCPASNSARLRTSSRTGLSASGALKSSRTAAALKTGLNPLRSFCATKAARFSGSFADE